MIIALVMLLVVFLHYNSCRSKVWKAQPCSQGSLLPIPVERERERERRVSRRVWERTWEQGCEKQSTFLINEEEGETKLVIFLSLSLTYRIISDWKVSRNKKRTYDKTSNKKKGWKSRGIRLLQDACPELFITLLIPYCWMI